MNQKTQRVARSVLVAAVLATIYWVSAGDLNPPPGPIAPTNRVQLNSQSITLPYTIAQAGSYVLTSDLVGSANSNGVIISSDDVTFDLNGFALIGGTGSGIVVSGSHRNLAILNGVVVGWTVHGVNAASAMNGSFTNLRVTNNDGDGLRIGSSGQVSACTVEGNGSDGIAVGSRNLVTGCLANNNDQAGIRTAGDLNRVEANHATGNATGFLINGVENLLLKNSAAENATDYSIALSNAHGPIAIVGAGDISSVAGADHPWANFSLALCTQEICDGADNDCDGQIDEGLGSTSCGVGECFRTVQNCIGGATQTCTPGTPTAEVCDGLDNNCNGQIDDGLGTSSCGDGACFRTVQNCIGGTIQTCIPGSPTTEVCDGIDNDCDRIVDNGPLCPSGFCVDGVCCDTACTNLCMACSAAKTGGSDGTCGFVTNGTDPDNECFNTECDGAGSCTLLLSNGSACLSGSQCLSRFCVDGLCCNTLCGGTCQACSRAKNGVADGVCTSIPVGQDPDNECLGQGVCNASGVCVFQPNGALCTAGFQCLSGFCVDGRCCNSPCSGLCRACSLAKNGAADGVCLPVPPGQDPDNECPGPFSNCNGGGGCN